MKPPSKSINGVPIAALLNPIEMQPELVERIAFRKVPGPQIAIVEPDARWVEHFHLIASRIRAAFDDPQDSACNDDGHHHGTDGTTERVTILAINHYGSTSVPGLPAKPVIDIDLVLSSTSLAAEAFFAPLLESEAAGSFQFLFREPAWYNRRFFATPATTELTSCNLHVWGPQCAEVERHLIFRDWLRESEEDRELYAKTKKACAALSRESGENVLEYNLRKEETIRQILTRAFTRLGYLE